MTEVPDWSTEEFLETELGEATCMMEDRMSMVLGDDFIKGNVTTRLDLLFEGLADVKEIAYYCARISMVYGDDILLEKADLRASLQGAVSQALCLGILLERRRGDG